MNGAGRVHGGAIAGLIDIAATAWATDDAVFGTPGTTLAVTANILAPGLDGTLRAEGRIIRVHVADRAGNGVAEGQVSYKLDLRRP